MLVHSFNWPCLGYCGGAHYSCKLVCLPAHPQPLSLPVGAPHHISSTRCTQLNSSRSSIASVQPGQQRNGVKSPATGHDQQPSPQHAYETTHPDRRTIKSQQHGHQQHGNESVARATALTRALSSCHRFGQVLDVLQEHHDICEEKDAQRGKGRPNQHSLHQRQQQPTLPSAATASLLNHLNHRHMAILWLTLSRVVEEQEWKKGAPPSSSSYQQPHPTSSYPGSPTSSQDEQQQPFPPLPPPPSSTKLASLSRREVVELRRLMAALERAALRCMEGGGMLLPSHLQTPNPVQGRVPAAADGRRPAHGAGEGAANAGRNGPTGSTHSEQQQGQKALWSFHDMANAVSAMGRLGHVPSERCVYLCVGLGLGVEGGGVSASTKPCLVDLVFLAHMTLTLLEYTIHIPFSHAPCHVISPLPTLLRLHAFLPLFITTLQLMLTHMHTCTHTHTHTRTHVYTHLHRWLSCFVSASLPALPNAHPLHLSQAMCGLATLEMPPGQVRALVSCLQHILLTTIMMMTIMMHLRISFPRHG